MQAGPAIKVGYTADVQRRVKQLQTGQPYPIKVLGFLPDARQSDEARWHQALRKWALRGEWFLDCAEIRYLVECVKAGARPRTVTDLAALVELAEARAQPEGVYRVPKAKERTGVSAPPAVCAAVIAAVDALLATPGLSSAAVRYSHIHRRWALKGFVCPTLPPVDSLRLLV